eukprot:309104-Amphidinium_carterae.2
MQQNLPLKARPSCLVVGCSAQALGKALQDPLRNAPGITPGILTIAFCFLNDHAQEHQAITCER